MKPSSNALRYGLYGIFFLSGFSALIYESIWSHYLKLFLGHAAYAQTLVLAIFMGGMGLGAWWTGKHSHRLPNLLLAYALVETVIGVFGLVFHGTFVWLTEFSHAVVIPSLGTPLLVNAYKWLLGGLLILPQSVLLGATFPLMAAGLLRLLPQEPGRSIAILYFSNSLGAVFGVLASGFYLIAIVGLPGTIFTAGLLNFALAVVVYGFFRFRRAPDFAPEIEKDDSSPRLGAALFLLCAAVTGAASFMYEIGWIRMLSMVLGSSTHAFELMLSAFILGLAIGGLWIKKHIDSLANPKAFLGYVQLLMGLLALATLGLYGNAFDWMATVMSGLARTEEGYLFFNLASHAIALAFMLPATICAGMTLPLLTRILIARGDGEKAIGRIYAANTLGSIIGVMIAVHLLMPFGGLKSVVAGGALLDIALGILLLWLAIPATRRHLLFASSAVAVALFVAGLARFQLDPIQMASGVYRYGVVAEDKVSQLVYHRDGKTATVAVKDVEGVRLITTNGKPDAGISIDEGVQSDDEPTMVLAAGLPLSMVRNPRTAAAIGMGSGLTTHVLLSDPRLERVDTIEIEPAMIEGASYFGSRVANGFVDPRSHLYIEDAKTFFASNGRKYDIIVSEPSNPWVSGVASLFSYEFYDHVTDYLEDDGLFVQWYNLYETTPAIVASVAAALSEHFHDYVLYATVDVDLLIIASARKKVPEPQAWVFDHPALAAELKRVNTSTVEDLKVRRIAGKQTIEPLLRSLTGSMNSDYYPIVDLTSVKARFMNQNALEINALPRYEFPLVSYFDGGTLEVANLSDPGNFNIQRARRARQALQVLEHFRAIDRGEPGSGSLAGTPATRINTLAALADTCHIRQLQDLWFDNMWALAKMLLPYFEGSPLVPFWNYLLAEPCFDKLPGYFKDWVYVLKAIGDRDHAGVIERVPVMLSAVRGDPRRQGYLVMALAGSFAMSRQYERAIEVMSEHDRLFAAHPFSDNDRLAARYLRANIARLGMAALQGQGPAR